jgi:hypothetical protein
VRITCKRQQRRRLVRLPRIDLAVRLVELGVATCRKAASIYSLAPDSVLSAFNRRNPTRTRSFT